MQTTKNARKRSEILKLYEQLQEEQNSDSNSQKKTDKQAKKESLFKKM